VLFSTGGGAGSGCVIRRWVKKARHAAPSCEK